MRIDLHVHLHNDDGTAAKLDQILAALAGLQHQEEQEMITLDDIRAQVAATKTVEASAVVLINSIPGLIEAAVAKATNLTDLQAELASLTSDLKTSADGLGAAVVANTPAAPPAVPAPDAPPST